MQLFDAYKYVQQCGQRYVVYMKLHDPPELFVVREQRN